MARAHLLFPSVGPLIRTLTRSSVRGRPCPRTGKRVYVRNRGLMGGRVGHGVRRGHGGVSAADSAVPRGHRQVGATAILSKSLILDPSHVVILVGCVVLPLRTPRSRTGDFPRFYAVLLWFFGKGIHTFDGVTPATYVVG